MNFTVSIINNNKERKMKTLRYLAWLWNAEEEEMDTLKGAASAMLCGIAMIAGTAAFIDCFALFLYLTGRH